MSVFRNFKPRSAHAVPHRIFVSQIVETPQSDGRVDVSVKMVDASSFNLPSPYNYQLKDLVSAGVPLSVVSCKVLDSEPTDLQISSIVNKVIVEPETND